MRKRADTLVTFDRLMGPSIGTNDPCTICHKEATTYRKSIEKMCGSTIVNEIVMLEQQRDSPKLKS